ncbi:uncharacterized protein A1O9_07184 [Exophiala aquamarina CBS 119918]|uniref:Major facilitator superfamily (MFS) profile domain-containing protein n=1 Tax=Exophiala aquamarina CBS 119918 TaxID=1182545 RepID=A0A072PA60_9EURO|nr:uncharacterized protein A1O9_07184 [Exophiala aquamarina CBS 119918]KEF56994.1 hypothetical protein A1O9_07184 [Exophiala aquamarina CBS 119918]
MSTQATVHNAHASPETALTMLATTPSATEIDAVGSEKKDTKPISDTSTHNGGDDCIEKPTGLALCILLAAVFSSGFLMALNGSMVATALPQITTHFHSLKDIGWYGSAYLVSTCTMQPLAGKIYTHFPIKVTYLAFSFIFFIGSLLAATATTSAVVIVGRGVQGIGGAGIVNGAFMTIAAAGPEGNKPILVGVAVTLGTIGSITGPMIGGALTEISWRWCFYVNLPAGGLVLCAFWLIKIPEQMRKPPVRPNLKKIITEELDLVGFLLFAPACIMLLLAIAWGGNEYSWASPTIIGLFCGAFVTSLIFGFWEFKKGETAMIPPRFLRNNLVVFGCCTSCFQNGGMLLLSYYLPLWFQVVKNASPTMSGVDVLPTAISQALSAVMVGKLVQVIGYCTPWAIFGAVVASIGGGLLTTLHPPSTTADWIGYQVLIGFGRAPGVQMPVTAVQGLLKPNEVALATSQIFFFQYLGAAVFISVGETIFSNTLRTGIQSNAPNLDAEAIIAAGAFGFRSFVAEKDIPGVLQAYNHAITTTYYLALGGTCAAFFTSFGMGWQRLPKRNKSTKKAEKDSEEDTA